MSSAVPPTAVDDFLTLDMAVIEGTEFDFAVNPVSLSRGILGSRQFKVGAKRLC